MSVKIAGLMTMKIDISTAVSVLLDGAFVMLTESVW